MSYDKNGVEKPPVIHRMVIIFNETTNQFRVEGIPQSKVTALGMVRLAEHAIIAQVPAQQSPIVKLPPGARLG